MFAKDALIDVGSGGITGWYKQMVGGLRANLASAIISLGLWQWVLSWPPHLLQISPGLSVPGIIKFFLMLWTLSVWGKIAISGWHGWLWLRLEAAGMHWVRLNDNVYRVTFWRRDGNLQFDRSTWHHRLDEEISCLRHRRTAILREGGHLAALAAIFLLIAAVFDFLYREIAYLDGGRSLVSFLRHWNLAGVVLWLWFFFVIVPKSVEVGLIVLDEFVYRLGAQFVPGAKVRDRMLPPKTLETVRAQKVHGAADFVRAGEAARQMSER